MNTPNFTSLLTALRAFVLKSRPAYRDYLGTESVEEKTVLLTGTLSATGESVTAADGFAGFANGQTYKATIGDETVEVTAQYGTGSFSECIVIGSSNVAPSDTIPGWMVCVYNGNLLGFGTGDWAGKQIEVATSKMVSVQKWDTKKLPEECLPETVPETWAVLSDTTPLPAGIASPGTSSKIARADHVHPEVIKPITDAELEEMWSCPYCLTFSSPEPFSLYKDPGNDGYGYKGWDGVIEYSTNKARWRVWDGEKELHSENNVLYIRGTGNHTITKNNWTHCWRLTGSNVSCSGNIETLLDWPTVAQGEHPTMAKGCFSSWFQACAALVAAPELPATTLAVDCYSAMFRGCTSLATAPALPATTLAGACYQLMFMGCTSLTTAPALPATTLASSCYSSMFLDCTSLTTVPALPATTLANYCYSSMFRNCTSLIAVPKLPATTLTESSYDWMFYRCQKIKLSTIQTDEYTQEYRIPTSGTGSTATRALNEMFKLTGGTFTGTPAIDTIYYLHKDNSIVPATR